MDFVEAVSRKSTRHQKGGAENNRGFTFCLLLLITVILKSTEISWN